MKMPKLINVLTKHSSHNTVCVFFQVTYIISEDSKASQGRGYSEAHFFYNSQKSTQKTTSWANMKIVRISLDPAFLPESSIWAISAGLAQHSLT